MVILKTGSKHVGNCNFHATCSICCHYQQWNSINSYYLLVYSCYSYSRKPKTHARTPQIAEWNICSMYMVRDYTFRAFSICVKTACFIDIDRKRHKQ